MVFPSLSTRHQSQSSTIVLSQNAELAPYTHQTIHSEDSSLALHFQVATHSEEKPPNNNTDENPNTTDDDGNNGSIEDSDSVAAHNQHEASQDPQQEGGASNPTVYGWTPADYPNPLDNPIRCGVAYLPQYSQTIPDNGQMTPPEGLSSSESSSLTSSESLRLCDPDWMLGGMYLEKVAMAMKNFTQLFGPSSTPKLMTATAPVMLFPIVDLAVATARKMDLPAVLREGTFYAYEDDDDMVNDAAQLFAHDLHDVWWNEDGSHGILIFLSIQDRVCFISTGSALGYILPWWRLDHVVSAMKPALREREYGKAVLHAIEHLSELLVAGPPSLADRLHDFCARFGVVILFATFTFFFGAWGEYRDRRKRFQFAEDRSKLKGVDREKASLLQQGYKTRQCPICLESFTSDKAALLDREDSPVKQADRESERTVVDDEGEDDGGDTECGLLSKSKSKNSSYQSFIGLVSKKGENETDSYGIPLLGADGKRIKLLRCGHIFCESCWKSWVHSGCGNPCNCPVCRQDIGKTPRPSISSSRRSFSSASRSESPRTSQAPSIASSNRSSTDGRNNLDREEVRVRHSLIWGAHPTYDSVAETRLVGGGMVPDSAPSRQDDLECDDDDSQLNESRPLLV